MNEDQTIEPQDERHVGEQIAAWYASPIEVDPAHRERVIAAAQARPGRRRGVAWRVTLACAAALVIVMLIAQGWWHAFGRVPQPAVVSVRFVLRGAPTAVRVAVVGDFNGWDAAATPLARGTPDPVWAVDVRIRPGRYAYAFVVDGREWIVDPTAPLAPDDFGRPTSVIVVGEGAT